MGTSLTWSSFKPIALLLEEKYPQTDLLAVSDQNLREMISSLTATAALPQMPKGDRFLYSIKTAWIDVRGGEENSQDSGDQDAYI